MSHVEVRTSLRDESGEFIPATDWEGPLEDELYIAGAIDLSVDGLVILEPTQWDYVDQLWAYVIDMLITLQTEDRASTYFPDQPLELTFQRTHRGWILVTLRRGRGRPDRQAHVRETALYAALREAGMSFFSDLGRIAPTLHDDCTRENDRLSAVRARE